MHPEYPTLGYFFGVMYKLTNLPIVTIALVEGVARAGACDFVMAFDIRFGASKFRISHIEACVGVYASGGGSMRLLQSVGKARALEYLYSGRDVTAEEAEKYGWINRAFPSSESMREFSTAYINRVQKFPLAALATTKARINSASGSDALEVWEEDFKSFMTLVLKPETQTLVGEIWTLIKDATYCEEEIDLSNALMTIPSYK
jgi:enoyl-CoA hydratase/carnithine racemase